MGYGAIETTTETKIKYSKRSLAANVKHKHFNKLFPQYKQLYDERKAELERLRAQGLLPEEDEDDIGDDDGYFVQPYDSYWFDKIVIAVVMALIAYGIAQLC